MKIVNVEATILQYKYENAIADAQNYFAARSAVLVKVYTDTGIIGIGESACFGGPPQITKYIIENELKPIVMGEDPTRIEWNWQNMFARTRQHGRGGVIYAAMSGIDIALWDILGKETGMPIYKLLGGYTDKVTPYASSGFYSEGKETKEIAEEVRSYFEKGFKYAKIKIGRNPEVMMNPLPNMAYSDKCNYSLEEDLERVEACCKVAEECHAKIIVDANNNWNTFTAIQMGKKLQSLGVYWLEEPLHLDNIDGSAELASALDMPVAGYESEIGFYRFRELITRRAVDIVQPDCIWSGGITECRRIANLALAHNLPCNPHVFSSAVSMAANLHFLASISNAGIFEMDRNIYPLRDELITNKFEIAEDGYLYLPEGPGLGITLNEECIEKYKVQ
ncbi:MAG: mandelate racemase/muconate lactonizing enzyme family protein [Clostridium sp.]|nr:mandelate racemase/muconate lactonizing enzyme family protein [Clostridium sp.]